MTFSVKTPTFSVGAVLAIGTSAQSASLIPARIIDQISGKLMQGNYLGAPMTILYDLAGEVRVTGSDMSETGTWRMTDRVLRQHALRPEPWRNLHDCHCARRRYLFHFERDEPDCHKPLNTSKKTKKGRPYWSGPFFFIVKDYFRSKRSNSITLTQAETNSATNFASPSLLA